MIGRPLAPHSDPALFSKNHYMIRHTLLAAVLIALSFLAGCRPQETTVQSAPIVLATPTPRSTPLPQVATAIPAGVEGNPIQMVIYSAAPRAAANFASRFETALVEASGVAVQVLIVDRYAEALAALCDSAGGMVSVAWVDGLTYMAGVAQGCGDPVLLVEKGRGRNAHTGETGVLIANSDRNFSSVSQVEGDIVCRLGYEDFWTWMVPSLVLQARGVNPTTDLEAINDYPDIDALIQAVADGDCDAAGIPVAALDGDEPPEGVSILETTVEFPYPVLMFPPQLPLGARVQLTEGLLAMANDTDSARTIQGLLEQDALLPVTAEDFAGFTAFLERTGLDFAQLGG